MVVGGFGALAELPIVVRLVVLAVVRYFGLVHFALGGWHGRLSASSLETFTAFQIDNVLDNAESLLQIEIRIEPGLPFCVPQKE
jgi:Tfp pilus assembly protein PilX